MTLDAFSRSTPSLEWAWACLQAEKRYFTMMSLGCKPEEARSVLPNSLKTAVVVTANLREWRHIFQLRAIGTTGRPHPQMVEVMMPLLKHVNEYLSPVFGDLLPKEATC
jgi:thymidylate synthase (FAD)